MADSRHAALIDELRRIAGRVVEECGVELVELTLRGSSQKRLLRLDVDRPGPGGVGLEDCKKVSDALGNALEDSDLLNSRYVLEVSSPGIDRPIVSDDDIRRNTGRRVVVTTSEPIAGHRSFRGVLVGCREGCIEVTDERQTVVRIPRENVEKAQQDVSF